MFRERTVATLRSHLLAGESIVLTAEKRVGKTAVLAVLEASSGDDLLILRRDVEGIGSPKRLVEVLCNDLYPHLGAKTKAANRFNSLLERLGHTSIGPITLPAFEPKDWRVHLEELFAAVAEHLEGRPLALLWDEAPWMVEKVRRDTDWQTAADLLDELRAIRQRHPTIRFLFTGSIGFHHVLRDLRDGASHLSAINDMRKEELPPLATDDAVELARALMRWSAANRGASFADDHAVAARIAERCEGIPWFIHATVDDLPQRDAPIDVEDVDRVIEAARMASADGWELRHYVDRLDEYYGDRAELAGEVLDAVAVRDGATPDEILGDLAHSGPPPARRELTDLLRLLHQDHYLSHEAPRWRFTYELIRDAWVELRDLEPT
ncbi:MAG: hypothetical protein U0P45_08495 [Acidimicrobiales bacterium]